MPTHGAGLMTAVTAGRRRAKAARPGKKAKRRSGVLGRLFVLLFVVAVVLPVGATLAYRFAPPPITSLMVLRFFQGRGMDYRWRGIDDISPTLAQAAIASEDARFCLHHGFEFAAMEKALEHNEKRPGKIRGGSTISQQTAKNAFLWPNRDYARKGLEAYFTVLTEALWGKRRIMEVYLNIVEWGSGVYGAEAASQVYFGHSAKHLTTSEAAHLVAILPSPLKWKAVNSGRYVQRRAGTVAERVGTVRNDGLAGCVLR
ncbi:MAG: monofunctional biosynthetic peptidoglycan transglycosylase [Caulobacteraceae bacterium]|nr:monofunctional biosynthetic peptidoglycan transglycosylase [Caulobacteraceae bacterium]